MATVENLPSATQERPIGFGRLKRKEDARFIRGKGNYLDDLRLPGMLLVTSVLLEENPDPTEEEIRWAISGNICRCTGYQNIVKSVQWAAKKMKETS